MDCLFRQVNDKRKDMDQEKREQEAILETNCLLDRIFDKASREEFSEIHFDPFETELRIRYRKEGDLVDYLTLSTDDVGAFDLPFKAVAELITTRLKEIGKLDVRETRLPQDGRISLSFPHLKRPRDLVISTSPTAWGEKIFLRVLGPGTPFINYERLTLDPFAKRRLTEAYGKTGGIIIVAGPTGSGKTTTQNAILKVLNDSKKNILTAEWPVEYSIPGVNQVDCKFEIGYSDAVAMRAFLEQKPDVIKAKLEDPEMSKLAFTAASKNALVLCSIHTNSAASTISRLKNMRVSVFDLATYVLLVQAQRLVRRLCPDCKEEFSPSAALLRYLKIDELFIERLELAPVSPEAITFFKQRGCEKCSGSGFVGHVVICESLKVTPKIQEIILHKSSDKEIEKAALEDGMLTLRDTGLRQVILGNASLEEIIFKTKRNEETFPLQTH